LIGHSLRHAVRRATSLREGGKGGCAADDAYTAKQQFILSPKYDDRKKMFSFGFSSLFFGKVLL
jgi:hypothetical protein